MISTCSRRKDSQHRSTISNNIHDALPFCLTATKNISHTAPVFGDEKGQTERNHGCDPDLSQTNPRSGPVGREKPKLLTCGLALLLLTQSSGRYGLAGFVRHQDATIFVLPDPKRLRGSLGAVLTAVRLLARSIWKQVAGTMTKQPRMLPLRAAD